MAKQLHPREHNRTVLSELQVGDLIEFPRGYYSHWGVFVGLTKTVYCSKEKMVGSACTGSHSSRCINKSEWSGDYLGDVIPLSGITVKIESDDKDGNGILTNEVAIHDQELEGKCDVDVPDQELEGQDYIHVPDQELGVKCDREIPAQELEGKCEVALHDQELEGKCDSAVPHQELEGKGDIAVPDQELAGKCDVDVPAQELEGKCEVALHDQELEGKCDLGVPHQELEGKGDIAVPDQELEGACDISVPDQETERKEKLIDVRTEVFRALKDLSVAINDLLDVIMERYFNRVYRDQMLIKRRIKEIRSLQIERFDLNINVGAMCVAVPPAWGVVSRAWVAVSPAENSLTIFGNIWGNVDKGNVQQLRFQSFQRKESNQNSVLDSEFSCCFEPMVNVKRHGSNEEYYNFDQEENKNQENIKRTDHEEFIGKSTEHTKSTNCLMSTTRLLIFLILLPAFVMSESTTEKSHEQYLWHSDRRILYEIVSPCSPNPCLNDGSCTVDVDAKSVCTCNGEWTGFDCSISPCVNNPCENNGTCSVDVNGNATCTCDGNWNGTYCQVSPCDSLSCLNEGSCRVEAGVAACFCKGDYSGTSCEVSPCSPNPCMNDGSCSVDFSYEATCACNGEWSGFYYLFSPCDNNPCENNGTCSVDVNGNATCTCDGNWNGTYCQEPGNVTCDFEESSGCDYAFGSHFVWREGYIQRLPSIDHTIGNESGHYMYFKSSSREEGILISPYMNTASGGCLYFYYNMEGGPSVELKIYIQAGINKTMTFYANGIDMKTDQWKKGWFNIPPGGTKLFFHTYGDIYYLNPSIVAIDDIFFDEGTSCPTSPNCSDNGLFGCKTSSVCIPQYLTTDGYSDCFDSSDELDWQLGQLDLMVLVLEGTWNLTCSKNDSIENETCIWSRRNLKSGKTETINFGNKPKNSTKFEIDGAHGSTLVIKNLNEEDIRDYCYYCRIGTTPSSDCKNILDQKNHVDENENWMWQVFEEDETFQCYDYFFMEERSEQRDTNSESCTRKSSVYVELAPVLKPHCFINLSELKALSQNVILQKKAAKQKKTSKDNLSHEQTSNMFKVMIVCVLVVVAYLIIMEPLSLVLSSTFKTSVPAALCLVVLSSYQMYSVVSIVVARMEIVRKKQIYDENDGTHLLTDYERLCVIAYFCGSLVPGLWIYNELTRKLDPVELLIMCTTVCLTMMVVAWTTYLLHHIVFQCLIEIVLIARKVLVDSVAVIICFVSVIRVFIVSLFEFIFKRLSEIICVILMIFVTMLEHVARIEMLIMLMVTRVLEKLPVHSSIKAFQNDQKTMCLVSKYLFKRIPMNCDVMQDRIMGSETAQCCNRMRSFGKDSNMEDVNCEIETEKVRHLQETTKGHKFIESVSEIDHGKELKDHSLYFDCEICDHMERSETKIDEIKYVRSTTNDVCCSETLILTDLLHSTPVERDHEVCDTMEKSETKIDEISYERAYEMSTIDDMYSNETIILKDLSHSTPAERNHLSTKKSIHEETNVKRLVCNDTTYSLDEDNLMRVELEDLENLSVDEFNITQVDDLNDYALQGSHGHLCSEDNDIADQNVFDYIRSIEIEEDGEPFCRNTKLEDDDEPFCRNTKSTSIDRCSNRVWSLPDYHIIPELNKDYQVIPELNKGDISNTSMKSDSEFASNSLKNGSGNGSLLSSCSCNVDAHVFNCQVDSPHSFVNDSNNAMQSSRTVIDLQKRQESKSHARIVDSKKKPLLKEMINENVPTTEDVCTIVRNTIETIKQKSVSNLTKKSCKKCFSSYRKKPRRRLTRRRLRRLIYSHRNISHVHVDIEARPLLNGSERNATKNGPGSGLNNVGAADLATSQKSLTTSLPSSSNSLNNYFIKLLSGYEFSTDEKMEFEMIRVQSFQDLPASCNVSPLRLARTGFFSSGSGDEVTCFSCGVKYKGWQNNDNPNDVHRRISSDCRMVNGRETRNIAVSQQHNGRETRNIPVSQQHNGIIEHSGQQESLAHTTNDCAQSTVQFDGDVSTQTAEATQNREMTSEEIMKSNFPDNIQQSTNIKPPVDQPYSRQPALDRRNTDQPAADRACSVPDHNRPAQRDVAEDLGINLDKPKYPAYAQLNVRVSTFQGWPGYLDQTPRDMALAGFFYAGYNDYCRCFFCGGGLRNWDSGDDPWVEHTRWFPKCAFVQQNRGRRFVEIIIKRQAEMQASGNSVGNTKNQRAIKTQIGTGERSETSSQTSSQSADSNSTIDPAKASVRELGYADEIIDRAITIIKQNNPSKQKIEATDIMEVIFTITEDSETNTAVASENTPSSELNLPSTSQAVPQSNVSSQSNQPMSHSSQSNKPLVSKPNQPTAVASQSTNASENSLPSLSVSSLEHGNAAAVKSTSKEISENEIRSLQEENIQLKEQVMCKICMDKNVSIAFLPCGHLACCIDCAPAMRKCPMCRVYIKGTVKTFLA